MAFFDGLYFDGNKYFYKFEDGDKNLMRILGASYLAKIAYIDSLKKVEGIRIRWEFHDIPKKKKENASSNKVTIFQDLVKVRGEIKSW